jgi:hypothetical protein
VASTQEDEEEKDDAKDDDEEEKDGMTQGSFRRMYAYRYT